MNQMRWLMRLSRLARHPPSRTRLILYAVVALACIGLWAAERYGLLPEGQAGMRGLGRIVR